MTGRSLTTTLAWGSSGVILALLFGCATLGGVLARTLPLDSATREWLLAGQATTLTVLFVTLLTLTLGLGLGAAAALGPRLLDSVLSRAIEVTGGAPSIVVALVVARATGAHDFFAIGLTLGLLRSLATAKVVRAEVRALLVTEFVLAARALGAGNFRLFRVHLLPHVVGTALASATLTAAAVTGLEAALSFLGLGSFGPSWGALVAQAALRSAPSLALAPALGVAATLSALYFLGAALEERASAGRRFL